MLQWIEDNVNGIIIPVKNVEALEKAMRKIKDAPDKLRQMKSQTRNRIIERYQQEFVWNELLKTYQSLES